MYITDIIRSQAELADSKDTLQLRLPVLPERIYYIFVSPSQLKQHTWNIDVDEPNYIYRWHKGELTALKEREDKERDKQNRFLDDTPVTVPEPVELSSDE